MIGNVIQKIKNEQGAVQIIEATIVFPVMFIILFFLIYMGNAHYLRSQIESIVADNAIKGAAYCVDPLLETIKETGAIPTLSESDLDPYRYFSGMNGIEKKIGEDVANAIEDDSVSLFRNMVPEVKTATSNIAKYHNYVVYSTFSVQVQCEVEFPIKFLGERTPKLLTVNSCYEIAVNDTAEFMRNTDMVIDYFADSKLGQSIKGVFDKINDFINTFASK